MRTNIYHISYTPTNKEVSLFFWGCNFHCLGCLCLKKNRNFLLKENLHLPFAEPSSIDPAPQKFLSMSELMGILDKLDFDKVLLEGQEAALDPTFSAITKKLHERYGCNNTLCTNLYQLPDLSHTDAIAASIKTIDNNKHLEYTGKPAAPVQKHFEKVHKSGQRISVATVFIPEYFDLNEVEDTAAYIASVDNNILLNILPYFKAGFNPWRHPTPEEMQAANQVAKKHLKRVFSWTGHEKMSCEVINIY
jgi:pyruvate-formate lyase-activating enzyme